MPYLPTSNNQTWKIHWPENIINFKNQLMFFIVHYYNNNLIQTWSNKLTSATIITKKSPNATVSKLIDCKNDFIEAGA